MTAALGLKPNKKVDTSLLPPLLWAETAERLRSNLYEISPTRRRVQASLVSKSSSERACGSFRSIQYLLT